MAETEVNTVRKNLKRMHKREIQCLESRKSEAEFSAAVRGAVSQMGLSLVLAVYIDPRQAIFFAFVILAVITLISQHNKTKIKD